MQLRYVAAADGRTHLCDATGTAGLPSPEDRSTSAGPGPGNHGRTLLTREVAESREEPSRLSLRLVAAGLAGRHRRGAPGPTDGFAGVLVFVIDVTDLAGSGTRDVRSGKSGYAWVIDDNGTFLHHPGGELRRQERLRGAPRKMPTISFERINEIQKYDDDAGKEGPSWYVSGWHRGGEGGIRKLIAYAPIFLPARARPSWSVAVAAPTTRSRARSARSRCAASSCRR